MCTTLTIDPKRPVNIFGSIKIILRELFVIGVCTGLTAWIQDLIQKKSYTDYD